MGQIGNENWTWIVSNFSRLSMYVTKYDTIYSIFFYLQRDLIRVEF